MQHRTDAGSLNPTRFLLRQLSLSPMDLARGHGGSSLATLASHFPLGRGILPYPTYRSCLGGLTREDSGG